MIDGRNNGAPGTTGQKPRWEGPEENRPAGYLPAKDDPDTNPDAAGETLKNPDRRSLDDAVAVRKPKRSESGAPKDTEFAGHPDFSQDAAANKPPKGIGNSEPVEKK